VVITLRDAEAVARAAADAVVDAAFKAIRDHGDFRLVLAGGKTPRLTYELLSGELREEVDWRRVRFFFGDERCVPPTDPRSNYRMAKESLFDPLHLPPAAAERIAGELEPEAAAASTRPASGGSSRSGHRCSTWCCWAWGQRATRPRCSPGPRPSTARAWWWR
jgi:6-phosphogluconolactonase